MEESRKQFEEWWNSAGRGLIIINYDVQRELQWAAWQASRAAIEIELPDHTNYDYPSQVLSACAEELRAAGLKIKGE